MRKKVTDQSIKKKIKKGFGQEIMSTYKPWLSVRDFGSLGVSSRILSSRTDQIHHLLSLLESYALKWWELSPSIARILDNIALLPLGETEAIARLLGIRHPNVAKTNVVMTTDFLVIEDTPKGQVKYARTIKYSKDLSKPRVIEKFAIEAMYWKARGVDWGIVTEKQFSLDMIFNIKLLHPRLMIDGLVSDKIFQETCVFLSESIPLEKQPLRNITNDCDNKLGLEPGTSLAIAYHLIARGQLRIDLNKRVQAEKILRLL